MTMFNAMKVDRAAEQAKREDDIKQTFDKWLQQPLVKMLIATIPQPEGNPEGVVMLLRACYEAGYGAGAGTVVVSLKPALIPLLLVAVPGRLT